MAQTLVRKVMLQIDADDGDTEEKLDKITAKAEELKKLHPDLTPKIEAAAVSAKIKVIGQELKDLNNDAKVDVKVKDDVALTKALTDTKSLGAELDKLAEKGGGGNGNSGGLLSKLLFGENGENGIGAGSGGGLGGIPILGTLLENPLLLAGVVGAIGAAASEIGALATGLTAAGLGIGSFAALAYPAFKQVTGALGDTKGQLAKLPGPVQQAVGAVKELEHGFDQMAKAFQPTVFKIMNEGLGVASQLLPYLGQFATSVAPALEGVIGMISSGLRSDQFGGLMALLEQMSGPVIKAVGSGLKGLAGDVATLMERFSTKDAVNSINIAFRVLGATITLLTGLIIEGQLAWDFLTRKALPAARQAFDVTRHAIAVAGHDIAGAFDFVRHAAASDAQSIANTFDTLRHAVANWAHDYATYFDEARGNVHRWWSDLASDGGRVISWFGQLPGKIEQKLSDFGTLLVDSGKSLIHGLISGIENSVPGLHTALSWVTSLIPSWKGPLSADAVLLVPSGQAIMQGLINGLASKLPALKTQLAGVTAQIAKELTAARSLASGTASATESTYNLSSAATTAAGGTASASSVISTLQGDVTKIRKFAYDIKKLAKEGLNKSYLQQLIAMGPDACGALAAELVAAGMGDIRQINAAESQITAASNRLGDASVSALYTGGTQTGSAYLQTLKDQQKALQNLTAMLAKAGTQKLQIEWVGGKGSDQQFLTWLKKNIRIRGGNGDVLGA